MTETRTQCPKCGTGDGNGDNLICFDNGSQHCFACGYHVGAAVPKGFTPAPVSSTSSAKLIETSPIIGTVRGISKEVMRFYGYEQGTYKHRNGQSYPVQVATYTDIKGTPRYQQMRFTEPQKDFLTLGGAGIGKELWGRTKFTPNPNFFITITEGALDAMSIQQAILDTDRNRSSIQFPVVSLPAGAAAAATAIKANLDYLLGFKHVVLAFDSDEAGRAPLEECIKLFPPGRVQIVEWPSAKDANEMLQAGRVKEIRNALFNARDPSLDRIVTVEDIIDDIVQQPKRGLDFPWPSLTEITYGLRWGEIYIWVAANSVGKTEVAKEIMFHFLQQDVKIGLFSFEQDPSSTVQRLVGSMLGKKLHLPGAEWWDEEKIREEAMKLNNNIFLYKQAGYAEDEDILRRIHGLVKSKGVKLFIIDNLKGLAGSGDVEEMKKFMRHLQAMRMELNCTFMLLSHVAKDKYGYKAYVSTSPKNPGAYLDQSVEDVEKLINKPGMEWETGRMPKKENVEGSSAVADLADYVFALARNTTSEDPIESRILRVKCLKARLDGLKQGTVVKLYYDDRGRLIEMNDASTSTVNFGGGYAL